VNIARRSVTSCPHYTSSITPIVADKVRRLRDVATSNADFLRLAGENFTIRRLRGLSRHAGHRHFRRYTRAEGCASGAHRHGVFDCPHPSGRSRHESGGPRGPAAHECCLVGLRRNEETLKPDVYLDGLPESLIGVHVVLCDPMLATGGSLVCVLDMLGQRGAGDVTVLCLIAAQPGVDYVFRSTRTSPSWPPRSTPNSQRRLHHAPVSVTPATDSSGRPRADQSPMSSFQRSGCSRMKVLSNSVQAGSSSTTISTPSSAKPVVTTVKRSSLHR